MKPTLAGIGINDLVEGLQLHLELDVIDELIEPVLIVISNDHEFLLEIMDGIECVFGDRLLVLTSLGASVNLTRFLDHCVKVVSYFIKGLDDHILFGLVLRQSIERMLHSNGQLLNGFYVLMRDSSFSLRNQRLEQFFCPLNVLLKLGLDLVEVMGQELVHILMSLRLFYLLELLLTLIGEELFVFLEKIINVLKVRGNSLQSWKS